MCFKLYSKDMQIEIKWVQISVNGLAYCLAN
uniref:Uncharacterized protein n=1 Tax=Nelumbo nucifera TaxID=4432 RepID=A0A822Y6G1_NELNU|nr:TPA_asm: hypothetical protein HUJ06_029291 [Nelumbo nucifera]